MPRILLAWLVGAAFGIAGAVLQQVLQNPLASPTTFGVSGGAALALGIGLVAAPAFASEYRSLVALLGAGLAFAAIVAVGLRHRLAPLRLALAGLLISLVCGAGVTSLLLLQGRVVGALAIWGAGSLDQQAWSMLRLLGPQVTIAALAIGCLAVPLGTMLLGDDGARSLGVPVAWLRGGSALFAVWLSGAAVGAAGAIPFVDLAAASTVRLLGPRRFRDRLLWAAATGAVMLWFTDALAQWGARLLSIQVPTGAIAGLLGAPILVALVLRGRMVPAPVTQPFAQGRPASPFLLVALAAGLLVAIAVGLSFGRGSTGWHWSMGEDFAALLPWRGPRVAAAVAAGILLALAGVTTQRLTANPMASPELLGVSAAASLAICIVLALVPDAGRPAQLLAGFAGTALVLLALLTTASRRGLAPTTLVLTGIGLSALLGTSISIIVAAVPYDTARVLAWVGGSTYYVDAGEAALGLACALAGLLAVWAAARPLDILSLGDGAAASLGLHLTIARAAIVMLAAALTAAGTLIVGPFAFIGLMAPHLARLGGFTRSRTLAFASALVGASILVGADFLSRNILFPYQLPAGTTATFLGLIPMIWLLRR